jgi:hypothetical protein
MDAAFSAPMGIEHEHRLTVDVHGAGTALCDPATELRTVEVLPFTQGPQQRHVGVIARNDCLPVD